MVGGGQGLSCHLVPLRCPLWQTGEGAAPRSLSARPSRPLRPAALDQVERKAPPLHSQLGDAVARAEGSWAPAGVPSSPQPTTSCTAAWLVLRQGWAWLWGRQRCVTWGDGGAAALGRRTEVPGKALPGLRHLLAGRASSVLATCHVQWGGRGVVGASWCQGHWAHRPQVLATTSVAQPLSEPSPYLSHGGDKVT